MSTIATGRISAAQKLIVRSLILVRMRMVRIDYGSHTGMKVMRMNDRKKIALLMQMLFHAISYLKVVVQKEDPQKCAIPLTTWLDRTILVLETIDFMKDENE